MRDLRNFHWLDDEPDASMTNSDARFGITAQFLAGRATKNSAILIRLIPMTCRHQFDSDKCKEGPRKKHPISWRLPNFSAVCQAEHRAIWAFWRSSFSIAIQFEYIVAVEVVVWNAFSRQQNRSPFFDFHECTASEPLHNFLIVTLFVLGLFHKDHGLEFDRLDLSLLQIDPGCLVCVVNWKSLRVSGFTDSVLSKHNRPLCHAILGSETSFLEITYLDHGLSAASNADLLNSVKFAHQRCESHDSEFIQRLEVISESSKRQHSIIIDKLCRAGLLVRLVLSSIDWVPKAFFASLNHSLLTNRMLMVLPTSNS